MYNFLSRLWHDTNDVNIFFLPKCKNEKEKDNVELKVAMVVDDKRRNSIYFVSPNLLCTDMKDAAGECVSPGCSGVRRHNHNKNKGSAPLLKQANHCT